MEILSGRCSCLLAVPCGKDTHPVAPTAAARAFGSLGGSLPGCPAFLPRKYTDS